MKKVINKPEIYFSMDLRDCLVFPEEAKGKL